MDEIVIHPDWLAREQPPVPSNSKHQYLEPGNEDVALIFLAEPVTGVTPSPVADADYWVGVDISSQDFTVVGYGTDAYITGSAAANHPIVDYDGDRSYREVSAIPAQDAFPDRYIKVGAGVCLATPVARCSTRARSSGSTPGRSATAAPGRISSTASTPPRRRRSSTSTSSRI